MTTLVTAAQIATIRRLVAEPTEAIYTDELITTLIEAYPHTDEYGEDYLDDDGVVNADWTPTYDLNATASDIWSEKASVVSSKFDFSADGGNYSQSQQFEQYMKQSRYFRSRKLPTTAKGVKSPREWRTQSDETWIGNLPESD
jgi:hypothetical protein